MQRPQGHLSQVRPGASSRLWTRQESRAGCSQTCLSHAKASTKVSRICSALGLYRRPLPANKRVAEAPTNLEQEGRRHCPAGWPCADTHRVVVCMEMGHKHRGEGAQDPVHFIPVVTTQLPECAFATVQEQRLLRATEEERELPQQARLPTTRRMCAFPGNGRKLWKPPSSEPLTFSLRSSY